MAKEKKVKAPVNLGKEWAQRIICLIITGVFASIANTIYGWRTHAKVLVKPWECFPALAYMFVIIIVCCILHDLLEKVLPFSVPLVLYVSVVGAILSFPGIDNAVGGIFGIEGGMMAVTFSKFYSLLVLCTPVLAYAGIASGKELGTFKKQGVAIVVVALLTFVGTYIGSAIIAQIILSAQGVI